MSDFYSTFAFEIKRLIVWTWESLTKDVLFIVGCFIS